MENAELEAKKTFQTASCVGFIGNLVVFEFQICARMFEHARKDTNFAFVLMNSTLDVA